MYLRPVGIPACAVLEFLLVLCFRWLPVLQVIGIPCALELGQRYYIHCACVASLREPTVVFNIYQ